MLKSQRCILDEIKQFVHLLTAKILNRIHLNYLPSFDLDLALPITHRKGVRTCTKHLISKFVSYYRLSPSFKAFATNLSSTTTPRIVQDALANLKSREVIIKNRSTV